eukprot:scaffold7055_cov254-Pinguiococcus_pyrenoidosus.AAC.24
MKPTTDGFKDVHPKLRVRLQHDAFDRHAQVDAKASSFLVLVNRDVRLHRRELAAQQPERLARAFRSPLRLAGSELLLPRPKLPLEVGHVHLELLAQLSLHPAQLLGGAARLLLDVVQEGSRGGEDHRLGRVAHDAATAAVRNHLGHVGLVDAAHGERSDRLAQRVAEDRQRRLGRHLECADRSAIGGHHQVIHAVAHQVAQGHGRDRSPRELRRLGRHVHLRALDVHLRHASPSVAKVHPRGQRAGSHLHRLVAPDLGDGILKSPFDRGLRLAVSLARHAQDGQASVRTGKRNGRVPAVLLRADFHAEHLCVGQPGACVSPVVLAAAVHVGPNDVKPPGCRLEMRDVVGNASRKLLHHLAPGVEDAQGIPPRKVHPTGVLYNAEGGHATAHVAAVDLRGLRSVQAVDRDLSGVVAQRHQLRAIPRWQQRQGVPMAGGAGAQDLQALREDGHGAAALQLMQEHWGGMQNIFQTCGRFCRCQLMRWLGLSAEAMAASGCFSALHRFLRSLWNAEESQPAEKAPINELYQCGFR